MTPDFFDPRIAQTRYGCGLSPVVAAPQSTAEMLGGLGLPDPVEFDFPIEDFPTFRATRMVEKQRLAKLRRKDRGSEESLAARDMTKKMNQYARRDSIHWQRQHILRRTWTSSGFRERLTFFWTDHFTARGKAGLLRRATSPYSEAAIRPNLTGTFAELLTAAVTHPLMLHYLDQTLSTGPASVVAVSKPKMNKGLNENLAREVLELHTLGVDGPYTQDDVRQLAELFTGMTFRVPNGFGFRKTMAEPGAETVLGKSYGGTKNPHFRDVQAVLNDLAVHPATAAHIAEKLVVHFIGDTPNPELVDHVTQRFLDTGGQLNEVYDALLTHPAAWEPEARNVKPPFDFITSALRALAVSPEHVGAMQVRQIQLNIMYPLVVMGQPWEKPEGPDGWPEEDTAWISPQGLAARLQWAITVPQLFQPELPDPRDFVEIAIGPDAPQAVRFAASAAESKWEGVGLVLASPAFQRV